MEASLFDGIPIQIIISGIYVMGAGAMIDNYLIFHSFFKPRAGKKDERTEFDIPILPTTLVVSFSFLLLFQSVR